MILGLRTAIYPAPDFPAAKRWYTEMLGVAPYFDEPFYVGFSVGGFELGLLPDGAPGTSGPQPLSSLQCERGTMTRSNRHLERAW
jgi:catechol 2,3-dioxygenase-like lactoylglutathione lyase family enzyme